MKNKKTLAFAIAAIILLSTLGLALDLAAASQTKASGVVNRPLQKSWIRINGIIEEWGTTEVRGTLQTQTRTSLLQSEDTRKSAGATAIWTTNITRAIQAIRAKENFTYVFYTARLLNGSVTTLSASSPDTDYVISGTWNLTTVTSTTTVITNAEGEITKVLRNQEISPSKAYGELTVTDNWSKFTLAIDGIDPLTGSVFRSMMRSWFNPFKITDDSTSSTITKSDIGEVGKCYGAMPGWGSYDTRMDFNNNYRIDIADISTVAAKI
jgi:hypothetical protein